MNSVLEYFKMRMEATCSPMDVKKWLSERPGEILVIDVRNGPPHLLKERIVGSVEIQESQIASRITEIPIGKEIILYCWETWCSLAGKAAIVLLEKGYRVKELYGGLAAWKTLGLPVEPVKSMEIKSLPDCNC